MKIMNAIIVFIFAAQMAQAQTQSGDSGTTTVSAPSGPSVNQNANNSQGANDSGAGMSMIMGAGLAAMGVKAIASQNYATGAMLLGMAALSFMQGGEHGSAAGSAAGTADNTTAGVSSQLKPTGTQNFGGLVDVNALKNGVGGVKADFNKGTVSLDGKTYPASAFASPASMQAAGFNPADVAKAMEVAALIEKKVSKMGPATATNGFDEGGGGGASAVAYAEEPALGGGGGKGPALVDRGPASVAGMTKDFNGEPIGVAADSIFEMMNRRYTLKDKQNAFINENEPILKQK